MQNYVWTFLQRPSLISLFFPLSNCLFRFPVSSTNSQDQLSSVLSPFRKNEREGESFLRLARRKRRIAQASSRPFSPLHRPEHRDKRGVMPRYLHIKFAPSSVPLYSNDYSSSLALDCEEGRGGRREDANLSLSLSFSYSLYLSVW